MCHDLATETVCSGCLNDLANIWVRPHQQIATPDAVWSHEWQSANYIPPLPSALHDWKHGGKTAFSHFFQMLMLENPPIWLEQVSVDAILPMPISASRRLTRGFNQCDELADAISAHYQMPILPPDAVSRQHKAAQSTLNKAQRIENIKNSFTIQADIRGQNILLIDDIYTTGATLGELARCVQLAGAKSIFVWVMARKI